MKVNVNYLVNAMCSRNINQSQLAQGAGVRPATISEVINGKRGLQIGTINKISAFLGIQPEKLAEVER
jgi:plasmid maintenance system antidote protein VapI